MTTTVYKGYTFKPLNLDTESDDNLLNPSSLSPRAVSGAPCGLQLPSPNDLSPTLTPTGTDRRVSWEESLDALAHQLGSILHTPTSTSRAHTAPCSPRPVSPNAQDNKVPISHIQSDEKFREKLSTIVYGSPRGSISGSQCGSVAGSPRGSVAGSPRGSIAGSPRGSITPDVSSPPLAKGSRRHKNSLSKSLFQATVGIGQSKIEDLSVRVEESVFKVTSTCSWNIGDLPAKIYLPSEVNPEKLICLVKDGVLEIRESMKVAKEHPQISLKSPETSKESPGELRRAVSFDPTKPRPVITIRPSKSCELTPIVLESDDTTQLKLVMAIPNGYTMDDIHIKTVDSHLIVSASHGQVDQNPQNSFHCKPGQGLFQVFELPERVDPYSTEAWLTDRQQLVIQMSLLPL